MKFSDYYEVLGVPRDAPEDDIRKAFRKLARKHHPDVAKDKEEGERKFKEINEAYEVLGDPEKRKKYDALGASWRHGAEFTPPPGAGGMDFGFDVFGEGGGIPRGAEWHFDGTGFSDFFEHLFGMRGGFAREPGQMRGGGLRARGRDVEADILVSLEESYHGSTRVLRLQQPAPDGESTLARTAQVRIPVGVREGQKLRLAGLGEPGLGGAPPGDLFLRVRLERHPVFQVRGENLYYDLDLVPWDAVLGTEAQVQSLRGKVKVTIPPGTTGGQELRLKGLGLPREGGGFGDLHVVTRITVPARVDAEERVLWEKLRSLAGAEAIS
ncbi:MAG TPA: J domain-containing protein [Verrucomicrobiales bacterium]|nr:J domain-containing protein [Verrucomicrobiales bacterium]